MADYRDVYTHQAQAYDALVSREDHAGNLAAALERAAGSMVGADIVEFGAGTGRVTRLLAQRAGRVRAFDGYPAMVTEGRARMADLANVTLDLADNRSLPVEAASADVTVAGWTFGHCVAWFPGSWRVEIGDALKEMARITRHGGTAVVVETLGTGREEPEPPSAGLAEYYMWLEQHWGFTREWIRTDYRFASEREAAELTGAFFGKAYALQQQDDGSVVLPECTGVWHRRFAGGAA